MIKIFFTVFILVQVLYGHAQNNLKYPSLSVDGYRNLLSLSGELKNLCPPKDCLLIFIGRSNILISAILESDGLTNLVTLPMSGMMRISTENFNEARLNIFEDVLSPFLKDKLASYRRLAIVDYTNSGESLTRSALIIQSYVENQCKLNHSIEAIAYGKGVGAKSQLDLAKSRISYKHLAAGPSSREGDFLYFSHQSMGEKFAPFDEYFPLSKKRDILFDRDRRQRFPYISGNGDGVVTNYASYNDLVSWFSDPNIEKKLFTPNVSCNSNFLN